MNPWRRHLMLGRRDEQARITAAQRRLRPGWRPTRTRAQYLRNATWWELEARRGYPSSVDSARYARNMRWAAELTVFHGAGTWRELIARAGVQNPEGT